MQQAVSPGPQPGCNAGRQRGWRWQGKQIKSGPQSGRGRLKSRTPTPPEPPVIGVPIARTLISLSLRSITSYSDLPVGSHHTSTHAITKQWTRNTTHTHIHPHKHEAHNGKRFSIIRNVCGHLLTDKITNVLHLEPSFSSF